MKKQQRSDNSKSIYLDTHGKMNIRRRVNTQSHNKNNLSIGQQTEMEEIKNKYSIDSKAKLPNRKNKYFNQFSQIKMESKYSREDSSKKHTIQEKIQLDDNNKDRMLEKLLSRNNLLKQQIYRIQKFEQQSSKRNEVKKQYSSEQIYFIFSTKQSLAQELANAYNKIKRMEVEINQIRKVQATDYNKVIGNLKQRVQQVDILKQNASNKLQKLKKYNKNLEENLQKSRNRGGYRDIVTQFKIQIQELADRQKQMIATQTKRKEKNLKQQEYIRRLQKQLMENGVSKDFVQDLMNRVVYGDNTKKTIEPIKQTRQQNLQKMQSQYKKMCSEMNILRKSIKQQQKLMQELVIMQKQSSDKHNKTKTLCKQLDEEIMNAQQSINQARKMINPQSLKPKHLPPKEPTLQDHRESHKEHLKQIRKKFYEKKTKRYLKTLQSMQKQINQFTNEEMNNSLDPLKEQKQKQQEQEEEQKTNTKKIQQLVIQRIEEQVQDQQLFGKIDQNGIKFSDKYILEQVGKQQDCKITSINILNSQNKIVGVQAKYNYKMNGKLHEYSNLVTFRQNDKNYVNERISQEFQCVQQQYVTSITGTFSSQSILINLTVLTNLNRYHKFGSIAQDTSQFDSNKQFQICNDANSYPSYIAGCVNRLGICQFGAKINKQEQSQQSNQEVSEN